MSDNYKYSNEQDRAVAGLSNIWTPCPGEIKKIIKQEIARQLEKNALQQAKNALQQKENALQQEIVRQQIVAHQREIEQQNPYYQAQIGNSPSPRTRSPPPTYFMTTPNGTIHYYY